MYQKCDDRLEINEHVRAFYDHVDIHCFVLQIFGVEIGSLLVIQLLSLCILKFLNLSQENLTESLNLLEMYQICMRDASACFLLVGSTREFQ